MRAGFLWAVFVTTAMTLMACAPAPTGSLDSKAEIRNADSVAATSAPSASGAVPTAPQLPEAKLLPEAKPQVWLRYARGACLGRCPQYHVTVDADGRFRATGFRHVPRVGEFSGQFSPAQLQALQQQLATLQALQKKWPNGQPPCTVQVSDQSEFRIESGALKLHWSACEGFADAAALQQAAAAFDAGVQETLFGNTR